MEQKKNYNATLASILIFLTLIWFYRNDTVENVETKNAQEQVISEEQATTQNEANQPATKNKLPQEELLTFGNESIQIQLSTLGAQVTEVKIKGEHNFRDEPIFLAKDNSTYFNLAFVDSEVKNTKDLLFQSVVTKQNELTVVSLTHEFKKDKWIKFEYKIPEKGYMIDFKVYSKGINMSSVNPSLEWYQEGFLQSKGTSYESRYTKIVYLYDEDKSDDVNAASSNWSEETDAQVKWIAYKQHFFASVLQPEMPFKNTLFKSKSLIQNEATDTIKNKAFMSSSELLPIGGEFNHSFKWYFGPSEYDTLKSYNDTFTEIVPLGWGIFGWINRFVFLPLFGLLTFFLPHGLAIIIMTLIVRLSLSPVTYKSYLSQVKMRVIRPEINEINEKYKNDAVQKQQELMKLYSASGVSPLSGCIPALIQLPIFYALFNFFPSAYELRQKSFLWAEDLSTYDSIYELPFRIPFYGDHISLLPILASIAIFFYMRITSGDTPQPTQPGMPNMKFLIYISPVMMLFFFNNYASGLSLYYFISNLITIFIMLAIKKYILDEEKIHSAVKEKQNDPNRKSGNRFQRRMQMLMEQQQNRNK